MEMCDIYLEDTLKNFGFLYRFLWGTSSRVTPPGVYLCHSLFLSRRGERVL